MRIPDILPSMRFTTLVGSIALCALLIYGAYVLTHPTAAPSTIELGTDTQSNVLDGDWRAALREIEGNKMGTSSSSDIAKSADSLLKAASSSNLTSAIGRKLLINLSEAKSQGLGSDIPTQDALIAEAVAEISQDRGAPTYAVGNLSLTSDTDDSRKVYANAFMQAAGAHTSASYFAVIYTIATSTDNNDPKRLAPLTSIGADYAALARDLSYVTVPVGMAPLHLQVVNNFARIGKTIPDLKVLYTDPLRALAALQLFEALNQETLRLFINIAQVISQNGILFSKDEPGAAWSSLVP